MNHESGHLHMKQILDPARIKELLGAAAGFSVILLNIDKTVLYQCNDDSPDSGYDSPGCGGAANTTIPVTAHGQTIGYLTVTAAARGIPLSVTQGYAEVLSKLLGKECENSIDRERQESIRTALTAEVRLLETACRTADVGYLIIDPSSSTALVSKGCSELTGIPDSTFIPFEELVSYIDPCDQEMQKKALRGLAEGELGAKISFRVTDLGGKTRYIDGSAKHLNEIPGKVIVTLVDRTAETLHEQDLLEMNRRYEEAQNIARLGSFFFHQETRTLQFSPEAGRIIGMHEQGEISFKEFISCIHKDDLKQFMSIMDSRCSSPIRRQLEFRLKRMDTRRTIYLRFALRAYTKAPSLGTIQDVSEEYRMQKALEEQRDLMRTMLDAMPAGMFWMDKNLVYQGCNRVFARDADGGTPEDIVGKTDRDFVRTQKDAPIFDRINRRILETGEALFNQEYCNVGPDGRIKYFFTNKVPILDRNKHIVGLLAVYSDITELKLTQQRLEESLRDLQAVMECSSDVICMISKDLKITFASPSVSQILGFDPEELKHLSFKEILVPDSFKEVSAALDLFYAVIQRPVENPREYNRLMKLDMIHRTGRTVHTEVHLSPMTGDDHMVYGLLAIVRDITRQYMMEEHIRESGKMEAVSRLAGGIAHDFNNMLQAVLGYAELLDEDLSDPRHLDMVQSIIEASFRARDLVTQLLLFSQAGYDMTEDVDLSGIIIHNSDRLRMHLGEGIACTISGCREPVFSKGNRDQLEQVVMNICTNARQAMNHGGELRIHIDRANTLGVSCISFTDSGTGIRSEHLPHVFEPFFSGTSGDPSSGLGLAASYAVIKQHGGNIQVFSAWGYGTRVEITFPGDKPKNLESPPFGTAAVSWEDDMVRHMITRTLEEYGFSVEHFGSSVTLEELLCGQGSNISLVMIDMQQEWVQNLDPLTAGLLQTVQVLRCGEPAAAVGDTALDKPFTMIAMIRTIEQMLDGNHPGVR